MKKKIKISLIIILSGALIISNTNAQVKNDTLIYWEKNQELQWRDFQGKVPILSGKDEARSNIVIHATYKNQENLMDVKVVCFFNKNISWTKSSSLSLLNHEQLHFDIAELYVRKIRKGVLNLRCSNQNNIEEYKEIVKIFIKEYYIVDRQYDDETAHGVNELKQAEWEIKIAKELEELKDYYVDCYN